MAKDAARALLLLVLLVLGGSLPASATPPSQEQRATIEKLSEKYRSWIEEVEILLTDQERSTFLALDQDYQRDAFIERFWTVRDTNRRTARNEFREAWEANARTALAMFHDLRDARSRILLLNGPPIERVESNCSHLLWPLEAWFYPESERAK